MELQVADLPTGNAAIGQSGGPTAVVNQSLAGVVEGLRQGLAASGRVKSIYGMRHGVRGIVKADGGLVDLTGLSSEKLEAIAATPSWRPMNPMPSPVVALRFTRSGPTRSAPASESRIDSR